MDHIWGARGAFVEEQLALPRTVIHGDFNAANVLVQARRDAPPRVAAVDWELAAAGSGLVDLATLVSGSFTAGERDRLVDAYAGVAGVRAFSRRQLALARLHVALRWLGWAPPGWVAPPGQRHDWLADARVLVEELGL
jgi:aminoglycoside phosphotransferase (APT) family kinase protein